ncbi:chaperone protein [Candidatus Photodesmus blepharus]|uniref:Chaperone protein n=1 Tax=Candidatus Photodesmus blepharonis TaxID=1179155 RepID=A0A084CNY3_9GAMM|nr:OmpH family outer membrane protein [Candidatus Photodesmus blepharus]KEY91512.1 chaperone protein [Candidatus Photodesmus blepharus]
MKKIIEITHVSFVLVCFLLSIVVQASQKLAYINTGKVFHVLPQREIILRQMQEEFKDKVAELETIQLDLKIKIEKLKRDAELLSLDETERLRIEISQLDSKYKIKAQALEKASALREVEEKKKLFEVIQDAVKKVAKEENYDLIIDVKALSYAKSEYDISEKVIKILK